jgi:serine protease Do
VFENHLGVDLTVTFTAQDRQWSDSFSIPADGTKEYCLDPGRYTYTIDAPPPWGSINGDLEVHAGDRYLWPIRGREG